MVMFKRFFDKVELAPSNKCWNWKASLRNGYGAFKLNGEVVSAHRVSYEIHLGIIPEGLFVCHTCDNPKCVNPKHLFLGTHADNIRDAYNKGRIILPEGVPYEKGHHPINAGVTRERADALKELIRTRTGTLKRLAEEQNISHQLARDISAGRVYVDEVNSP